MTPRDYAKCLSGPLIAIGCAGVLAAVLPTYPLGGHWLGLALLAYCALLWRWPHAWLLLVPVALPVLDLAPWTGRFFLDEFDALLAATLLMQGWRSSAAGGAPMTAAARRSLALFCLSSGIALLIGARPLSAPGLNGLNNYYSHFNGVRLAKGLAWALLLWRPLRAALAADVATTQRRFALGMGLGVLAASLGVGWERAAFTGLLNVDNGYRVVGLFSAMHTGGSYIEAYFALALPFLAWWTLGRHRWGERLAGAAMLALGGYALLVTYARAGYLAAVLGMLVLALAPRLRHPAAPRRLGGAALALLLLATLAWIASQGEVMQRRYASSARDLDTRIAHWIDAMRMIDPAPATLLAGMGLGSYPRTYFLRSGEGVTPTYQALHGENGNTYLSLATGTPLYLEQIVSLQPDRRYRLSFLARSADGDAALGMPICEKWMLYSARCSWPTLSIGATDGGWQRFSADVAAPPSGTAARAIARPLKLSIFSIAEGSLVDIDDVSLKDDQGQELLRNGDFGKGMDFWFFTSDNHLPWHLENTWLQIGFEQGLFGLAAFAALLLCAGAGLTRRLRSGDPFAPALAAALSVFLALSLLDSVFDFPRISFMVYLILFMALSVAETSTPQRDPTCD